MNEEKENTILVGNTDDKETYNTIDGIYNGISESNDNTKSEIYNQKKKILLQIEDSMNIKDINVDPETFNQKKKSAKSARK